MAGVKNKAIVGFPSLDVYTVEIPADIIDTDKDAEEIGIHIDGIFLPTPAKVSDFVAAHASIVDVEFCLGHVKAESSGDEVDVAVTEIVITVLLVASPFHIGNGVALKKKTASLFEFGKAVVIAANCRGIGTRFSCIGAGAAAKRSDTCCNGAALEKSTSIYHLYLMFLDQIVS